METEKEKEVYIDFFKQVDTSKKIKEEKEIRKDLISALIYFVILCYASFNVMNMLEQNIYFKDLFQNICVQSCIYGASFFGIVSLLIKNLKKLLKKN